MSFVTTLTIFYCEAQSRWHCKKLFLLSGGSAVNWVTGNQGKMKPVVIDNIRCSGCGTCAEICPYRAIQLVDGVARYSIDDCFLCSHCYAVCPENAVFLSGFASNLGCTTFAEQSEVIQPGTTDTARLTALMRSRRSCRKYRKKEVSIELLEDLVKIGTTAPSGTNSQGWSFIILPTRKEVEELGRVTAEYYRKLNRMAKNPLLRVLVRFVGGDSLGRYYRNYHDSVEEALKEWDEKGIDRLFHGATAAILVTGSTEASCPAEDALLASQNILLAAHTMGLGSCLIGFVVEAMRRDNGLNSMAGVSADEKIYSVIALGYPALQYRRFAQRKIVSPRLLSL